MNQTKFFVLIFFFSLCVFFSEAKGRHRPGRSKDDKKGKLPRTSIQEITTCRGQPVDLRSQVENSAQECLETRIQEIQEHVEANENGKPAKKEKRKEKLAKRLRKKCLPECEWSTFKLIPALDGSDNASYPSTDIPEAFLKIFPENSQDTLKAGMEACYNRTSPMVPKEGKKGALLKEKMCFTNMRLIKCLSKSVRQTCKGKAAVVQPSPGTGNAAAPKSGSGDLATTSATTTSSGPIAADDKDDNNDDVDDDDKDDEDNDDEDESSSAKPTPSTSVNTSKPLTK